MSSCGYPTLARQANAARRWWWVNYQPAAQLRLDEAKLRRVYAPSAFAAV